MTQVLEFERAAADQLPATLALLASANLTVHPRVAKMVLHGSRGPAPSYRPDSDVDLSLVVDPLADVTPASLTPLLREILATTLDQWRGSVEADLAVIFDVRHCGLKCFDQAAFDERLCSGGGVDCFGLFKMQKGF